MLLRQPSLTKMTTNLLFNCTFLFFEKLPPTCSEINYRKTLLRLYGTCSFTLGEVTTVAVNHHCGKKHE